jgi:hypothetical protein
VSTRSERPSGGHRPLARVNVRWVITVLHSLILRDGGVVMVVVMPDGVAPIAASAHVLQTFVSVIGRFAMQLEVKVVLVVSGDMLKRARRAVWAFRCSPTKILRRWRARAFAKRSAHRDLRATALAPRGTWRGPRPAVSLAASETPWALGTGGLTSTLVVGGIIAAVGHGAVRHGSHALG